MGTSAGFFVCVVLPTLLIVVYCAVNLILVIRKEKKVQTIAAVQEKEDERERIRQELLAEMQANAAQPAAAATEPSPQPAETESEKDPEPQKEETTDEKDIPSEDNKNDKD